MLLQRTLKSLTRAVGVGLHSGQKVELVLRPAAPDTGLVFHRIDLPTPVDIPVTPQSVCDTRMATTISPGGDPGAPKVQTIEHLLSAQLKQEEHRVTSGAYTTDFSLLGGATSDHYSYSATVSGLTYTLTATAKSGSPQANDTGCKSLTLNHQDARTPANCWD